MTPDYKELEKQLSKTHKFGYSPKYKYEFRTQLSEKAFFAITNKVFDELEWDVVYIDEHSIEAKRKTKNLGITKYTESIIVLYNYGNISVKSESLGNEMWDNGRNSKRVHLFIEVFKNIEKSYSKEELNELEKEQDAKDNWDDYVVPTALPMPNAIKKPTIVYAASITLLAAIILAFLLAKVSLTGNYILILFEFIIGTALAFALKFGIKLGNYTNFIKLRTILIISILIVFLGNQIFQYNIILIENDLERISFFEFIKMRFEQGLTIKSLNVGGIGLVISWVIQLGFTFAFGLLSLTRHLINYTIERIPREVIDFAYYNFVKGKTEQEVRKELASLGWRDEQNQTEVFEALEGVHGNNEMNRTI